MQRYGFVSHVYGKVGPGGSVDEAFGRNELKNEDIAADHVN